MSSDLTSLDANNVFNINNNQFTSFNPKGNGSEKYVSKKAQVGRLVPVTQTCTHTNSSAANYESKQDLLDARAKTIDASNVSTTYNLNHQSSIVDQAMLTRDSGGQQPRRSTKHLMHIQDEGSFDDEGGEQSHHMEQQQHQRAKSLSPSGYYTAKESGCIQFNDTLNGKRLNKTVIGQHGKKA
jgi:hypothetical protein